MADNTEQTVTEKYDRKQPDHRTTHHEDGGMEAMARQNQRAHLAPAPGTEPPRTHPFPAVLGWGLLGGVLLGAIAGWLFAWLLLEGTLVVSGWEQLYSMAPGTFYTFWVGIGIAAGVLIGGIATILATPVSSDPTFNDHRDMPVEHPARESVKSSDERQRA